MSWEEDARAWTEPAHAPRAGGLSLGFLAMLPLFAVYERGAAGGERSSAEVLLLLALEPLGAGAAPARWSLLGAAAVAAAVVCYRRRLPLGPGLLRVVLEGVVAAVALGPLLGGLLHLLSVPDPTRGAVLDAPPDFAQGALACGGAAWEELLFRVLAYGLVFLLAHRLARFLGAGRGVARGLAEIAGCLGSALLFAAFHLRALTSFLGPGGEAFDGAVFTWRLVAGILLALLFRWRGPGVAAWAHGLFNLGLLLAAGSEAAP